MAYIATKATYIGEEEVKDENGKPIVNEIGKPVKKIITDVDDVIFLAGEIVVLIEKINEDKHFDLSIEDEGSEYFAPTQIKIGDGFHSFRELKWLQTLDYNRVHSALDKSVEEHTASLSKDYTHFKQEVSFKIDRQNQRIDNFIYIDARKILREIVNNNYFRITNGGLVGFTTNPEEYADKNCISIGNNTSIEKKSEGYTIGIGKNNTVLGDYSLIIGTDNKTKFNFSYVFGQKSYSGAYSIACGRDCNWSLQNASSEPYCTACFGNSCITKGSYSFSCGIGNDSYGDASFTCSRNNISYGDASFSCGSHNRTDANVKGAFACGNYNNGTNKLFSIGNGKHEVLQGGQVKIIRQNIFDINTSGKAAFYGDLEIKESLFGSLCTSLGLYSYAGGAYTKSGAYSLSHGYYCNFNQTSEKSSKFCACFGNNCNTPVDSSFACGKYNIGDGKIFSIGNGSNENNNLIRKNAFDIDTSGKATFYGDLEVKGDISYKDISILPTNNNISTISIDKNTSKNIFLKDNSQAYTLRFTFAANKTYLLGIFYDSTNLTINTSAFTIVKNYEKTINNYTICSVDATESSNPSILFTNNTIEMQKIRVEFYEIS